MSDKKPGPKPVRFKVETDWEKAIRKALKVPPPSKKNEGEKKKAKK